MKLTLEIELGNEAMQTAEDVAAKLRDIARRVDSSTFGEEGEGPYKIMDLNGHAVGSWEVSS